MSLRSFVAFACWGFALLVPAAAAESLPRGHLFFASDFEREDPLTGWSGTGQRAPLAAGGFALRVERSADLPRGSNLIQRELPVEAMRGHLVHFSARVRAEGVSAKPNPWNGVKFMVPVVDGAGVTSWPGLDQEAGSFDWTPTGFRVAIPPDARSVRLVLGLEHVSGTAWYDDIRVTVHRALPELPKAAASGPVYKGHALPRLRGAMVGPDVSAEDLRVLGQEWNANLIRWQLIRRGRVADPLDLAAYDLWLQQELDKLDAILPACREYGLRVVVDLHSPPGGRSTQGGYAGSDFGLFTSPACQEKFVEIWRQIAGRYQDSPAIWAYDLANEPVEGAAIEGLDDWQELAERAARAIRQIDAERTIVVEPPQWGSPSGLKQLVPLDIPGVVYSVHMYIPHEFTHQGVHAPSEPKRYPGAIDGQPWDKARLAAALQPAVDFQKAYGAHLFIGEFSAIRWAPDGSAARYLSDVIEIFEEHGWDWSYHAFREWDGWSVEHGADRSDRQRSSTPTDRERLLRSWFAKNAK